MRRSKSDPSKYARNYRSISQRRMCQYDENASEEREIQRLRALLKTSKEHLKQVDDKNDDNNTSTTSSSSSSSLNKKRKRGSSTKESDNHNNRYEEEETSQQDDNTNNILSKELQMESADKYGGSYSEENPIIVLPSSKKKNKNNKKDKVIIQLTPQEIRQAKLQQKKLTRKLQQLETRAEQKKKRTELYKKLEENKISNDALPLLNSSGTLGRKSFHTKKQLLQKTLRKERAGITLTEEEKDLLYPEQKQNQNVIIETNNNDNNNDDEEKKGRNHNINNKMDDNDNNRSKRNKKEKETKGKKAKKLKTKNEKDSVSPDEELDKKSIVDKDMTTCNVNNKSKEIDSPRKDCKDEDDSSDTESKSSSCVSADGIDKEPPQKSESSTTTSKSTSGMSGFNFAAQMMASFSKLKEESDKKKVEAEAKEEEEEEDDDEDEEQHISGKKYIPSEPTVLKTAATLGIQSQIESTRKVMHISRPKEIETARYDLPVSAMEFELIDAVRNNYVTIICGETGSGKSTQTPQFLYEAGFTNCPSDPNKSFRIGITQPRRVAAVSTAKRVCYEMGQGDGQSIKGSSSKMKGKGNLVSYRTRYETAGDGSDTRVMFMTDGILLQEIQSDLLLRKYSVIVLDESHERNLNTDVLIGLLSVALPLRKKAAEDDPTLVPLKLIIMSATLRVEDFTKNDKLFSSLSSPPTVVRIPGRTFPVTIHYNKVTELDDYETVAYRKICKMHRKLPHGGILVFLTGKQEIIRMVNRLRKTLNSNKKTSSKSQERFSGANDVSLSNSINKDDNAPREMDDEEIDADDEGVIDDYDDDDDENDCDDAVESTVQASEGQSDESIPTNAYILPLYSMLSTEEQAKVFQPVPENHRLIVVATNIAETSITIPGISYVVDTGRQKCRNYSSSTGIASYDVMWISKAAADQRAGRAGRTGPGHCYRLYSSSLYSRHLDDFELPEVLTRPLEDVVLAMKALKISDVKSFPFPTPPDESQVDAAVRLLANIGCVDISNVEKDGGDGVATRLGEAVAKLPLGVRYGKMLLVAAKAGILDFAIVMVAVLSEGSPFLTSGNDNNLKADQDVDDEGKKESPDDIDQESVKEDGDKNQKKKRRRWDHKGGDVLAGVLAAGAFSYVGRGAGGVSEQVACRKFCDENGLNYVIMTRIQKMRAHLARLSKLRLNSAEGVAAKTGGFLSSMKPPNKLQENLLAQAIASGLLDNIALLAPPGSISGQHPLSLRSAFLSCSSTIKEPLFIDQNSVVYSRDSRRLPQWICYDSVIRKTLKDGTPMSVMKNITPIDPAWIGALAKGSRLLVLGAPLSSPPPRYDVDKDAVLCPVSTKFGSHGWEVPSVYQDMYNALQSPEARRCPGLMQDDSFRWFARFLLEGKVIPELIGFKEMLNDDPAIITRKTPIAKVSLLVSALSNAGVDSAAALRKLWIEKDKKFLFKCLKAWIKRDAQGEGKDFWIKAVRKNIKESKINK